MGFLGKLAFWKKKDDFDLGSDLDLGKDPLGGSDPGIGKGPDLGMPDPGLDPGKGPDPLSGMGSDPMGNAGHGSADPLSGMGADPMGSPSADPFAQPSGMPSEHNLDPMAQSLQPRGMDAPGQPAAMQQPFGNAPQAQSGINTHDLMSKDLEVVSAKLDSIRYTLESMNQRLSNIERVAHGEHEVKKSW